MRVSLIVSMRRNIKILYLFLIVSLGLYIWIVKKVGLDSQTQFLKDEKYLKIHHYVGI